MMPIEARVKRYYSELTNVEKKVADYFLENINTVFHMPISELAERAGVSQVAWVRFSQRIGFSGLKELKRNLYTELEEARQPDIDPSSYTFTDIKDFDNLASIIKTIGNNSVQAIQDTMMLFDLDELEEIVSLIIQADQVVVFGVGASALVADDFANKLLRIGKQVTFWRESHVQITYATTAREGDVCIFFSHSGATIEVLESFEIVKELGLPTISITRAGGTPLSDQTDFQLFVSSPEVDMRSGATSSRLAHLAVVDILFTAIANKNYENIKSNLIKSASALKHKKIEA